MCKKETYSGQYALPLPAWLLEERGTRGRPGSDIHQLRTMYTEENSRIAFRLSSPLLYWVASVRQEV